MMKLYSIFRLGGYAGGLIGIGLLLAGRRLSPPRPELAAVGGGLVIAGFLSFFCSYALFLYVKMQAGKRATPRARGPENTAGNRH